MLNKRLKSSTRSYAITNWGNFPFSHDLLCLRKRVETAEVQLPPCLFRLEDLLDYAGNARYDDPIALDEPTREVLRRCVSDLRRFVLAEIGATPIA